VYDNCPNVNPATAGPDYDFAQGPVWLGGGLVGAGQKRQDQGPQRQPFRGRGERTGTFQFPGPAKMLAFGL
jgi:hypothetical protein